MGTAMLRIIALLIFSLTASAQTTLSTCDYIANVLAQCKATTTVPPASLPPSPKFVVGQILGVTETGTLTGIANASTTAIVLNFDGSQVSYAMTIAPSVGGGFFAQLPPHFHDGTTHYILAKSYNQAGIASYFDNANPQSGGGNGGYAFAWK